MGIVDANLVRPLPLMEGLTKEFYDWCSRGELRFQRCNSCGTFRHIPRELCAECGSFEWTWTPTSGRGTVFTYTVVARALHPAFLKATPYAAAVVELEEGVRILSNVVDCPVEQLRIGMPVQVDFEKQDETVTLPVFRCR
ncbi:MAG TPA: Zn-ribbon domain-containing OB-fold protein [Steroidobacteraceae bacterium]|nr:Zn-ribbon domain-containing OB-fold protein [Steroidobacteraceae bacterium]